jgi:hypothetical protein
MHFHILQCICGYDELLPMVQIMMTTQLWNIIAFGILFMFITLVTFAQGSSNMLLEAP